MSTYANCSSIFVIRVNVQDIKLRAKPDELLYHEYQEVSKSTNKLHVASMRCHM